MGVKSAYSLSGDRKDRGGNIPAPSPRLWAISDLHLQNAENRVALQALPDFPEDWLVVAGDVAETEQLLVFALEVLSKRFRQIVWTPGNHELWTLPSDVNQLRGVARYNRLVGVCQSFGVLTPEDPYAKFQCKDGCWTIAPVFTLYDYSFRESGLTKREALKQAEAVNIVCSDEFLLFPDPYPSREAWCEARCLYTEKRLAEADPKDGYVMVGHFPFLQDLARLPGIPQFSLWCGTQKTRHWHTTFPTAAAVYGHLHLRNRIVLDDVPFHEVSLGYPRDWDIVKGISGYLRQILP